MFKFYPVRLKISLFGFAICPFSFSYMLFIITVVSHGGSEDLKVTISFGTQVFVSAFKVFTMFCA